MLSASLALARRVETDREDAEHWCVDELQLIRQATKQDATAQCVRATETNTPDVTNTISPRSVSVISR
jgi:hypothetical protein